ncbi:MAG: SagB/ThcOx family dehydrogenase [Promethearchaeota archaeon]|nr:MAG: SagB/ThcOx family dehydrogenase [Candidatus Lokiarchaeota archaeon]
MEEKQNNYGDSFQQRSKYTRNNLPRHYLDWAKKPKTYKIYEDCISKIKLPKPEADLDRSFWEVLTNRQSTRNFSQEPLSLMDLSLLLFGMEGITRAFTQFAYRITPSAGGLYPIEIYPVVNNINDLKQGIYHYNIPEHSVELLKAGDFRKEVTEGCLGQRMAYNSAINFIMTAVIERSKWKYLQRCYRYIYLDCGHIGQNLYLVAEALNLGACTIGAIFDDELNKILEIDGKNETAIYVGVVGKKRSEN